jgi:hypothetical protein
MSEKSTLATSFTLELVNNKASYWDLPLRYHLEDALAESLLDIRIKGE